MRAENTGFSVRLFQPLYIGDFTMTKENEVISTPLDEAYEAAVKTHEIYVKDTLNITPVRFFVEAFQNLYKELCADLAAERFVESRPFFNALAPRVEELEYDEGNSAIWRLWEQGVRAVEHYDAKEKARITPPARSIDELLANGVNETVVAKIYGFFDEKGRPDINAVRERRPWKPAPKKSNITPELQSLIDAANAAKAKAENDAENTNSEPAVATTKPRTTTAKSSKQLEAEIKAGIRTALDAEIEAGIAPRQIAAKHGCTVDDVKRRAEEMAAGKKTETKNAKEEK